MNQMNLVQITLFTNQTPLPYSKSNMRIGGQEGVTI
uniref:Uncharacterized protein n=1 Tax=Arundo donax TaxID=35708 RepID=A0A0A9BV14_ARUDO